jgi:hypothetical protein
MVVMAQTFHWSETRIAAYLQAEGEVLSPAQAKTMLHQGYQLLEEGLPEDIREVYLSQATYTERKSQINAVSVLRD